MLKKILLVITLGVFAALGSVRAQTTPTAAARVKGRIVAASVEGQVTAISKVDGTSVKLHSGDKVTDQTEIVTAPNAKVILVFSNGATVDVAGDSTLDIEQFEQDPFAADIKMSEMKQEPGTSTTKLNLTKGELVGKVVHLNVDKGSEFTVETPVGAAGIRGTTFRIVFRPARDGKAFFVVTTADGQVVFRGITAAPVNIPAGKTVVATFNYTPATPATATTPAAPATVSPVTVVTTTDVTPTESANITVEATAIAAVVTNVIIPSATTVPIVTTPSGGTGGTNGTNGTSGGTGGTNNTSPNGTQQSPPLSSGAGSSGS
jgi:hypothetical protein